MNGAAAILIALLPLLLQSPSPLPQVSAGAPWPFQDRRIDESSGVIASRKHPGLLWTMNDSGGDPVLFLSDSSGTRLGAFAIPGANNVDWEALGRGPCETGECLYIGDTGDNSERRASVTLYRVSEPGPTSPPGDGVAGAPASITVEYPDQPHDVEALYVEPDASVILVTKGRRGGILTFRVPASGWAKRSVTKAVRIDSLPIAPNLRLGRAVTDAAISPDGHLVVVRTYRELWFFTRAADGHLSLDSTRPVCDLTGLQRQGEAVDWWAGDRLVLTSERGSSRAGTILLVRCPVY
jgi:hypothetical protein